MDDSATRHMEALMADLEVLAERQGIRATRTKSGYLFAKGSMYRTAGLPTNPAELWDIVADLQRMGLQLPNRE